MFRDIAVLLTAFSGAVAPAFAGAVPPAESETSVASATASSVSAAAAPSEGDGQAAVRVVTSLTTYAAIAREIAGDRAEVSAIADGAENPHFVTPRPSLLLKLRRADLFVVTGLDLELWVPTLLDKANNQKIRPGNPGHVTAYRGIKLLDIPESVSRSQGDIHLFGNPHIWTAPANAVQIGQNILAGLKRVSPENASYFERRFAAWKERIMRAFAGDELVELLGVDAVFNLAREYRLLEFVSTQSYQGRPLSQRLGGWLKQAEAFRGERMVCYHKEWDYLNRAFDVSCVEYVEPKPGIPPTPQHVARVIRLMQDEGIRVLFSTNYYDHNQVQSVAARTGATPVIVPSNTDGAPGTKTYTDLVGLWIRELAAAYATG
ncbi:MAG: metal ABC transporter substrate-binding protein [Gemmatimonadota bacterium]